MCKFAKTSLYKMFYLNKILLKIVVNFYALKVYQFETFISNENQFILKTL